MAVLKDNSGNTAGQAKYGGGGGVRTRTASKFIPDADWSVESVTVRIQIDTGSPSNNTQVQILGNTGTVPNNSNIIGTATISSASVTGSYNDLTATFASALDLTNGTTYWVVIRCQTEPGSDSAYYNSRAITNAASNNGALFNDSNNNIWTNNTDDLWYQINGTGGSEADTGNAFFMGANF